MISKMTDISLDDIFNIEDIVSHLSKYFATKTIHITIIVLKFVSKRFNCVVNQVSNTIFSHLKKPPKYSMCAQAAILDNVNLLVWTRHLNFEWNSSTTTNAAY